MIFARSIDGNLASLVKKIDKAHQDGKICSFVCFLNDDEGFKDKVQAFADKTGIKKCVLALDNVAGPDAYKVAKDAEVTVIYYNARKVEVNHAYRKGEFDSKAVEVCVKDLSKIMK